MRESNEKYLDILSLWNLIGMELTAKILYWLQELQESWHHQAMECLQWIIQALVFQKVFMGIFQALISLSMMWPTIFPKSKVNDRSFQNGNQLKEIIIFLDAQMLGFGGQRTPSSSVSRATCLGSLWVEQSP